MPTKFGQIRVLVAEDSEPIREYTEVLISRLGASVTTAENGRLAIDRVIRAAAGERPFDLVLMDMEMPVLDGYAAARELRARGYALPILALTGHQTPEERERCLRAGCNEVITKPMDADRLARSVQRFVSGADPVGE